MKVDNLSADELALVQRHRDKKARELAAREFKSAAIATAKAFDEWSVAYGEGLTFSTFMNSFKYQGDDGKKMFEAVVRINSAALPPN